MGSYCSFTLAVACSSKDSNVNHKSDSLYWGGVAEEILKPGVRGKKTIYPCCNCLGEITF